MFFRKPHNIPTTFGPNLSFLEKLYIDKNLNGIMEQQKQVFGEEMGLLNRLDNETAGLIYFAKNQKAYDTYKLKQSQGDVTKTYILQTPFRIKRTFNEVCLPIAHHRFLDEKMVIPNNGNYRGNAMIQTTYLEQINYQNGITTLIAKIKKGIRHQIRLHMASLGLPLLNDVLYTSSKSKKTLQHNGLFSNNGNLGLVSVGLEIR